MSDQEHASRADKHAGSTAEASDPPRLQGAQRRIAESYFEHDGGLFVLNCVPGAGKSFVRSDIAAKELLKRWVAGESAPERRVCVVTFTREEASTIRSDIVSRLETLVTHDVTPAGAATTEEELAGLLHRVRQAPYIGTIDSVIRTLLGEILSDVGFREMPTIGNDAHLEQLHRACFDAVDSEPAASSALERLTDAYPSGEYDAGVDDLLRSAFRYCRSHRLSLDAFRERLLETVDAVYAEGETTSIEDIGTAIGRCVSASAAEATIGSLSEEERRSLVEADQKLRESWIARIEDFCAVLADYRETYDALSRERGVISHLDCAYLVAEFFAPAVVDSDGSQRSMASRRQRGAPGAEERHTHTLTREDGQTEQRASRNPGGMAADSEVAARRDRVLSRHRDGIDCWLLDEAQDLSALQHDALAPLVRSDARVLAAGDIRQSIYGWRDAHPGLFATAIEDGEYLGIDWQTHVVETATRTYRCRPEIARAINALVEPAVTDPERGNLGELDMEYPQLDAVREPPVEGEPGVHIAAFDPQGIPGSDHYVSPPGRKGEAGLLATYLAGGLADGTFTVSNETGDSCRESHGAVGDGDPPITVVFRRRRHMETYAEAFRAEGLSVIDASTPLFESPVVRAVVDVMEWLVDPLDPGRTEQLLSATVLDVGNLTEVCGARQWDLDTVFEECGTELSDREESVIRALRELRNQVRCTYPHSAGDLAAMVIERLGLRSDQYDLIGECSSTSRVAHLDALEEWLVTLDSGEEISRSQIVELLTPIRNNPHKGPTQPVTGESGADVVFTTIHQMKGDEADVIALADVGFRLWAPGPPNQRFVSSGDTVGLAPPELDEGSSVSSRPLSAFSAGLYTPDGAASGESDAGHRTGGGSGLAREVGLRWATEMWQSTETGDESADLVGHDRLQSVSQEQRAEAWRLLYVALTRARDHVVMPLPRSCLGDRSARDRWVGTLRTGLEFTGSPRAGQYLVETGSDEAFQVSVNDVSLQARNRRTEGETSSVASKSGGGEERFAGASPITQETLPAFVPRILRPSTVAPLVKSPEEWVLAHLENGDLHTDPDADESELTLPIEAGTVEPDVLGSITHSFMRVMIDEMRSQDTAAEREGREVRETRLSLGSIARRVVERHCRCLPDSTQEEVVAFLVSYIGPQLGETASWERIIEAEEVYLEKSLTGSMRLDGVEFEFDGSGDVVLKHGDGSWEILELKLGLQEPNSKMQERYKSQVGTYISLLASQVEGEISGQVNIVGAECEPLLVDSGEFKVEQEIKALCERLCGFDKR